jgi:hypothetical protein
MDPIYLTKRAHRNITASFNLELDIFGFRKQIYSIAIYSYKWKAAINVEYRNVKVKQSHYRP